MKILAFHNCKGGVGTTTLAAIATILAARAGRRVTGASLDPNRELRFWLDRHDVPWVDALELHRPALADQDLLVLDVRATTRCADLLRPDLWVVPMDNRTAFENAVASAPHRDGPELWVWSLVFSAEFGEELRARFVVPEHLADRVRLASPMIVIDPDIGAAVDEVQVPEDRGPARALHAFVRQALAGVGLDLATSRPPTSPASRTRARTASAETATEIAAYLHAHARHEHAAREHLQAFFAAHRRRGEP